jgi:hypothetical protein
MRRPNPWITIPALAAGILAGAIGWLVTSVTCMVEVAPNVFESSCPAWAAVISALAFVGVTVAMTVVMVLVARSIAEARAAEARGVEPPDRNP